MKPPLHPLSVLAGLALAGLVALLTGASQTLRVTPALSCCCANQEFPPQMFVSVGANNLSTFPEENVSYTVPSDRNFVVSSFTGQTTKLLVNGMTSWPPGIPGYRAPTMAESLTRFGVFPPGTVLSVVPVTPQLFTSHYVNFWGHLEPVN